MLLIMMAGWLRALLLLLLLLLLSGVAAAAGSAENNPLEGLPALPKPHHSFGMCSHWTGEPHQGCGFPVDSTNALQQGLSLSFSLSA